MSGGIDFTRTDFRKTITQALPAGAKTIDRKGKRIPRWRANDKLRLAQIIIGRDGSPRLLETAANCTSK